MVTMQLNLGAIHGHKTSNATTGHSLDGLNFGSCAILIGVHKVAVYLYANVRVVDVFKITIFHLTVPRS